MPHQCTNCGRRFPDGSKEMLSGCPDCGGNKFQFRPQGAAPPSGNQPPDSSGTTGNQPPDSSGATPDANPARNADQRRDRSADPSRASPSGESPPDGSGQPSPRSGDEDAAQTDARRDVVSRDELASTSEDPPRSTPPEDVDGQVIEPTDDDRPDLDELRDQLNDQFESIRIVNPGQYELNLMELYDRQEYIISLQEDGKYVIDVPDAWRSAGDE